MFSVTGLVGLFVYRQTRITLHNAHDVAVNVEARVYIMCSCDVV